MLSSHDRWLSRFQPQSTPVPRTPCRVINRHIILQLQRLIRRFHAPSVVGAVTASRQTTLRWGRSRRIVGERERVSLSDQSVSPYFRSSPLPLRDREFRVLHGNTRVIYRCEIVNRKSLASCITWDSNGWRERVKNNVINTCTMHCPRRVNKKQTTVVECCLTYTISLIKILISNISRYIWELRFLFFFLWLGKIN